MDFSKIDRASLPAGPWAERIGEHKVLEFIPVDPRKLSEIRKQMLDSLQYVKSHPEKAQEFLDIRIKQFFYATFDASELGLNFTKKDRKEIGSLIGDTILAMDYCLLGIGDGFDSNRGPDALRIRSGFQFMIDNFKYFPNGKSDTLEKAFEYLRHSKSIEILDESLAKWKNNPPHVCEENFRQTPEMLNRPKEVPASHHWWF